MRSGTSTTSVQSFMESEIFQLSCASEAISRGSAKATSRGVFEKGSNRNLFRGALAYSLIAPLLKKVSPGASTSLGQARRLFQRRGPFLRRNLENPVPALALFKIQFMHVRAAQIASRRDEVAQALLPVTGPDAFHASCTGRSA